VDKIFEIKNRREGGNFQDLLWFYQEKRKGKPDEQWHGYFAHNVIMPNSLYYYYYVYTHDKA
jgi:hypothetical protein